MATLKDTLVYLLKHAINKQDHSNARITKMIYLSDWHQALNYQKQITNIKWIFNNFGPYVSDIKETIEAHPNLFIAQSTTNFYGSEKTVFSLKEDTEYVPELTDQEKDSIDFIIKNTSSLNWDEFIKLVYSTHPIISSPRYSNLDLIEKAKEYISKRPC